MKQKRQQQILKIISERDIKTQEELTDRLKSAGFLVTQATVSRDIKELGLIKLSLSDGTYKY
ncbi:MAG: arginine repressor, partial [Firmicutes bacterium]|nr:arginine repressor [Bacillota bacterium]